MIGQSMLKKLLRTTLLILLITNLIYTQIISATHKPILISLNHQPNTSSMTLKFNISQFGTPVTIYNGYVFILWFPSGSLKTGVNASATINSIKEDSFLTITNQSENSISMVYNALTPLSLSGDVTISLSMNFNGNYFNKIKIGLYTSISNGILIHQQSSLGSFLLYNDRDGSDNDLYIQLGDFSVQNTTTSFGCTTSPCTQLYPFSKFNLTFTVTVKKAFDYDNAMIIFGFIAPITNGTPAMTLSSSDIPPVGSNPANPLFVALKASDGGKPTLTPLTELSSANTTTTYNFFTITTIQEQISLGEDKMTYNLINTRKFQITISNFDTNLTVGTYAISSIIAAVKWRNANSYLSYREYGTNISTFMVNTLPFKRANDVDSNLNNSVFHLNHPEIYENGSWPLKFEIKIPKIPYDGKLRITSVSTANTVLSLISSTCDYSDSLNTEFNVYGVKKDCIPTYNLSGNGASIIKTPDSTTNNSGVWVYVDKINGDFYDFKLEMWGYANKCSDVSYNSGNLVFLQSIFDTNPKSFALKFKYEFLVNGIVYAISEFTSSILCNKNLNIFDNDFSSYYYKSADTQSLANYANIAYPIFDTVNNDSSVTNRDYMLYQEFYDWNILNFTPDANSKKITSSLYSSTSFSYLSNISTNTQLVQFKANLSNANLPLPRSINYAYTNGDNANDPAFYTLTNQIHRGNLELVVPNNITTRSTVADCYLNWFSNSAAENDIFDKSSTNTWQRLLSITNNVIKTNDGNYSGNLDGNSSNGNENAPDLLSNASGSDNLGFSTNCFNYNIYDSLNITNMYTHVSFLYRFNRYLSDNNYATTRVGRFVKLFNGNIGFNANGVVAFTTSGVTPMKLYLVKGSNIVSDNNICILEILKENFAFTENNNNTLILTLQNIRLINVGDTPSTEYPVSILKDGIFAYPSYGEMILNTSYSSADLAGLNNANPTFGTVIDKLLSKVKHIKGINQFFGSRVIIRSSSGFTKSLTLDANVEGKILIPVHCPIITNFNVSNIANHVFFSLQSLEISSSGIINKLNNRLITYNSGNTWIEGSSFSNTDATQKNLSLKFPNYLAASTNMNTLNVINTGTVTRFYSMILFTKSISTLDTLNLNGNQFLGLNFVPSNIRGEFTIKVGSLVYDKLFYTNPNSLGNTISTSSTINFLSRPAYSTCDIDDKTFTLISSIRLHAIGQSPLSNSTAVGYVTNLSESLVSVNSGSGLPNVPTGDAMTVTISNLGTIYKNDNGATFKFTVNVYSNFELTGELVLGSNNFREDITLCLAVSGNTTVRCRLSNDTNNNSMPIVVCSGLSVLKDTFNQINVYCNNVSIPSTSVVTINKDSTYFYNTSNKACQQNYLDVQLLQDVTVDYSANNTVVPDVTTIQPIVSKVEYLQSNNYNAYGSLYLQLDLGRSWRSGQTIELNVDLSSSYIYSDVNKKPKCWFALTESFTTLETKSLFEDLSKGNEFVNSCYLSGTGTSHKISLITRFFMNSPDAVYSKFVLIRLSPILIKDLSLVKYSIKTYLLGLSSTKIANDQLSTSLQVVLPALTTKIATTRYTVTRQANPGLCNLDSIFPRIIGYKAEYIFNIDLTGSTDFLKNTINTDAKATVKVLNEISIFFDPYIYNIDPNSIWCLFSNSYVPCYLENSGFLNIRLGSPLPEANNHKITIRGIQVPEFSFTTDQITKGGTLDSMFLCSINYFIMDMRESLISGQGTNTISTYAPTTVGNIIFKKHPSGFTSSIIPRTFSTRYFRFNIDYTRSTPAEQAFLGSGLLTPIIIIKFSDQYDFSTYNSSPKATLSRIIYDDLLNTYYSFEPYDLTTTQQYNYIKLRLTVNPFTVQANNYAFDLKIDNVPTPWFATTDSGVEILILNDEVSPTKIFRTHQSSINSMGTFVSFDNYFNGPKFSYSDNTKSLIDFQNYNLNMKPGRYYPINATLTTSSITVSSMITIVQNPLFSLLMDRVQISSLMPQTKIMIGTSCSTLYGRYWVNFNLSNQASFYNLRPFVSNVLKGQMNQERIRISRKQMDPLDEGSFPLAIGGMLMINVWVELPPYEDISCTITTPSDQTNGASFGQGNKSNPSIKAKSQGTMLHFQILDSAVGQQVVNYTCNNLCYGFGSTFSSTRKLTFTLDGVLANLADVKLSDKFKYVSLSANDPLNSIKIKFVKPIPNTIAYFALICANADMITLDQVIQEDTISRRLLQTATPTSTNASMGNSTNSNQTTGPKKPIFYGLHAQFIKSKVFLDDIDFDIIFNNLQRGMSYQFMAWIHNFAITPKPVGLSQSLKTLPYLEQPKNTNATDSSLMTQPLSRSGIIKYSYTINQKPSDEASILTSLQKYVLTVNQGYEITLSTYNGLLVDGFQKQVSNSCGKSLLTNLFPPKIVVNSTNATNATNATTSLRYLQSNTTAANSTNATNTTNTTTVPPKKVYSSSFTYVLSQNIQSTKILNLSSIVNDIIIATNTTDNYNKFFGIAINGSDFIVGELKDTQFTQNDFKIQNLTYIKSSQTITFNPIGTQILNCIYSISPLTNKTNIVQQTYDQVMSCPAKSIADNNSKCGLIRFSPEGNLTALYTNGIADTKYVFTVVCQSDFSKDNFVIIPNNFDVPPADAPAPAPAPSPSSANATNNTNNTNNTSNEMFIRMFKKILLLSLVLLLC